MKKNYIPKEAEEAIYAHWENSNFFKAIPDKSKEPFCIICLLYTSDAADE